MAAFLIQKILGISPKYFSGSAFQRKEQAAAPAVLPPALLFCDQPCPHQIVNGPLHRPPGELQLPGYGSDGRVALSLLIAAVFQVHIHGLGAVRQLLGIDLRKIPHRRPPNLSAGACAWAGVSVPSETLSRKVLRNLSFRFRTGKHYAVIGKSGCGKSTLLSLLLGYYPNYSGSIRYDGVELRELTREYLGKTVAYVSQDTFLFQDTIQNNITLYHEEYTPQEIEAALNQAGLKELVDSLPEGLSTMVEENGKNFSGGEKQRFSLARALLRKSRVLLLDEFTTNLDKETAEKIEEQVMGLKDCLIITVTHQCPDSASRSGPVPGRFRILGPGFSCIPKAGYRQISLISALPQNPTACCSSLPSGGTPRRSACRKCTFLCPYSGDG